MICQDIIYNSPKQQIMFKMCTKVTNNFLVFNVSMSIINFKMTYYARFDIKSPHQQTTFFYNLVYRFLIFTTKWALTVILRSPGRLSACMRYCKYHLLLCGVFNLVILSDMLCAYDRCGLGYGFHCMVVMQYEL